MSFSYPSSARLKKRWEFDAVFRTGRHLKGELVRIVFLKGQEGGAKVGAVVSKKIACAAERSRGRRLIRESLRRSMPSIRDGARVVVSMRKEGLDSSARDVHRDICRLLRRADLVGAPIADFV